jgi:hypothetical protein
VQVKTLVPVEPSVNFGVLVSGVVVQDQMDRQSLGYLTVDGVQELEELGVTVPGKALSDHHAGQHVERREQRGSAVALVVVGHRACPARHHRQ